jgi:hypothetical protein
VPAYTIYGRTLESELELPELAAGGIDDGPFAPLAFVHRLPPPPDTGWFTIWLRPDGLPWLRAARIPHGYHLQYCNCAEFAVDLDRGVIVGAARDCADEMFRHFLVDQVIALMLSVRGIVLHASAVEIDGGVTAFAGSGGSGKSTIALALARHGHRIVSDDGLLLVARESRTTAIAPYAGIRVWPDSEAAFAGGLSGFGRPRAHAKQRFRDGLAFAGEGTLSRLYALDPGGAAEPSFEPLSPRDTAFELVRGVFRLALDDRESLARQLDTLAAIAPGIAAWRLSFPRQLDSAGALAAAVSHHAVQTVTR